MQSDQPSTAGEAIHSEASPQTARGTSSCLHILHITDCHLSQGADGELLGVNTRDSLDAVLARIAEDGQQPDLVIWRRMPRLKPTRISSRRWPPLVAPSAGFQAIMMPVPPCRR